MSDGLVLARRVRIAYRMRSGSIMPQKGTRCVPYLATFLKALLLFLLSLGQSYADDVLAQITTRLAKTEITQGNFQQEKRLKILRKPLHFHRYIYLSSKQRCYLENPDTRCLPYCW